MPLKTTVILFASYEITHMVYLTASLFRLCFATDYVHSVDSDSILFLVYGCTSINAIWPTRHIRDWPISRVLSYLLYIYCLLYARTPFF